MCADAAGVTLEENQCIKYVDNTNYIRKCPDGLYCDINVVDVN
jgi:hypothetical protein